MNPLKELNLLFPGEGNSRIEYITSLLPHPHIYYPPTRVQKANNRLLDMLDNFLQANRPMIILMFMMFRLE